MSLGGFKSQRRSRRSTQFRISFCYDYTNITNSRTTKHFHQIGSSKLTILRYQLTIPILGHSGRAGNKSNTITNIDSTVDIPSGAKTSEGYYPVPTSVIRFGRRRMGATDGACLSELPAKAALTGRAR